MNSLSRYSRAVPFTEIRSFFADLETTPALQCCYQYVYGYVLNLGLQLKRLVSGAKHGLLDGSQSRFSCTGSFDSWFLLDQCLRYQTHQVWGCAQFPHFGFSAADLLQALYTDHIFYSHLYSSSNYPPNEQRQLQKYLPCTADSCAQQLAGQTRARVLRLSLYTSHVALHSTP